MRIVVKVGTSTLAHPGGLLNIRHTEDLVKVWSDIQNAGHQLIVVSSAATGLGAGKLQIEKPGDLVTKQAAAAVGQCELMYTYDRLFGQYNHTVAQMLLTWEDFDHENRLHNLQNTLERLLQLHAIPIINENDPVACEEYSLGDNDTLAALVAKCIHADLVVLMSDIDGLYTADPHTHPDAKLIPVVEEITPEIEQLVERMKRDMFENGGCGLAAPQVGELVQLAIVDTEYTSARDYDPYVLINPVIVEQSDTMAPYNEGCLSIPGINCEIMRPDRVVVEAYDLDANLMRYEAEGDLFCVCLQHEIDHLHGKTMFERLEPAERMHAMRAYQDALARGAKPGETE